MQQALLDLGTFSCSSAERSPAEAHDVLSRTRLPWQGQMSSRLTQRSLVRDSDLPGRNSEKDVQASGRYYQVFSTCGLETQDFLPLEVYLPARK